MSTKFSEQYFKTFLRKTFPITDKCSHTWMKKPGCTFNIENELNSNNKNKLKMFYDKYYEYVFIQKNHAYITEIPLSLGHCPIKVDIDLRIKLSNEEIKYIESELKKNIELKNIKIKRKYDIKLIYEIIKLYNEKFQEYINLIIQIIQHQENLHLDLTVHWVQHYHQCIGIY